MHLAFVLTAYLMSSVPTLRQISSSLSDISSDLSGRAEQMKAQFNQPLTENELNDVVNSFMNIVPAESSIDFFTLRSLLKDVAHLSHKNWDVTETHADTLREIILPNGIDSESRHWLERILVEGNWDGATRNCTPDHWAVLVTGVNGIRKTTSIYQPWFKELLGQALVGPDGNHAKVEVDCLPVGTNSFFRQLDHMICTLTNEDFAFLYALTAQRLEDKKEITKDVVKQYSDLKAAIFTRYRTLSELLGAILLKEAQSGNRNCMMETSGRDVAMFHYVDHFFPKRYKKLALHFTINDLSFAKKSVDQRMIDEIRSGMKAVDNASVHDIIYANAGGPYGSEVLEGVQKDSDAVWEDILAGKSGVGDDWYKATIQINASETGPWTAQAVLADGSLGKAFDFQR